METSEIKDAVAFVSTFPPRRCGIATFCKDLVQACVPHTDGRLRTLIVAMDRPRDDYDYPPEVRFTIDEEAPVNYVEAAEFLNFSNVRAVSLQHEFGLFGGPDGAYALDLVRELRCPVITTCHTILDKPSDGQRAVMQELIVLSQRLVVMSEKGRQLLREVYDAPDQKVRVIPHGVPELPLVEPDPYKAQFGVEGRPVILTFGLLSRGKGIEYALRALPPVVKQYPNLCYIVLGATHPNVVAQEGESYRLSLQRLARELGLQKNVLFVGRFVEKNELCEFLKAADVYVTPYLNREQITSGTLAYAQGAGKPIVSTRYWHAEELLADGRGVLTDFRDPEGIANGLLEILGDPDRMREMRANAYENARRMVWTEVGRQYVSTFREAMSTTRVRAATLDATMRRLLPITGLPRPRIEHIRHMTDDTGMLQHARYSVPNRRHGYTTDDNARALMVATKFNDLFHSEEAEELLSIYLSFIQYAQRDDGLYRNFMGYDRQFLEEVGSDDCFGRALWGLGYVVGRGPQAFAQLATELFEEAISRHSVLLVLSLRGRAYAILGLYYYLQRYPEAHDIEGKIDSLAAKSLDVFRSQSQPGWQWFEPAVSYDNAVLSHALFLAHEVTGKKEYLDLAVTTLDFLIGLCHRGDHFSLVGNQGWSCEADGTAQFDQQPIDACGLVEACKAAFRQTGKRDYLRYMREAFDWFLGVNDLNLPLYDFRTGGCADGLTQEGPNQNQGAESTLCCMLALLTLTQIYSEQDRGPSARRVNR